MTDLQAGPEANTLKTPATFRSGFVAVIGRPNVGKSTLLNAFLGEKLAIVSPKPQTTRVRQLGILSDDDRQIIFIDTPGIHESQSSLGKYMVQQAVDEIPDSDVILFLVDISEPLQDIDHSIAQLIRTKAQNRVIVVPNKIDLIDEPVISRRVAELREMLPHAEIEPISAEKKQNLARLLERLSSQLPYGPRYYPDDQLTDTHIRDNAAEIIREKALSLFQDEIPHALAIKVEQFKERGPDMTYIAATVYVEKESQKGIVIGKKGIMLKKLGQLARSDLEQLVGTRVYLELWVKVLKNWRKNADTLKIAGFDKK